MNTFKLEHDMAQLSYLIARQTQNDTVSSTKMLGYRAQYASALSLHASADPKAILPLSKAQLEAGGSSPNANSNLNAIIPTLTVNGTN